MTLSFCGMVLLLSGKRNYVCYFGVLFCLDNLVENEKPYLENDGRQYRCIVHKDSYYRIIISDRGDLYSRYLYMKYQGYPLKKYILLSKSLLIYFVIRYTYSAVLYLIYQICGCGLGFSLSAKSLEKH